MYLSCACLQATSNITTRWEMVNDATDKAFMHSMVSLLERSDANTMLDAEALSAYLPADWQMQATPISYVTNFEPMVQPAPGSRYGYVLCCRQSTSVDVPEHMD